MKSPRYFILSGVVTFEVVLSHWPKDDFKKQESGAQVLNYFWIFSNIHSLRKFNLNQMLLVTIKKLLG